MARAATMERRVLLLLVAIAAVCATTSAHLSVRMPRRPGDNPKPMMEGPAPVNRGFARNCTAQQEEDDEIECEGEAFAAVQCKRRHCFCVDMETGLQLSGSRRFQRDEEFNCTQESQCPVCDTVCLSGYEQGRDNCDTCKCKRNPPRQRCSTISALVLEGGCSCDCVTVQGTRGCPMCNDDPCTAIQGAVADDKCVNESECGNATIQSVGPRGKPECVQDVPEGDECDPTEKAPPPRGRVLPEGVAARKQVATLGEAVTPCEEGTVCMQVGLRENRCKMEDEDSLCVQTRMDAPDIKCARDGSFTPVQCRPVNDSDSAEGSRVTRRRTPELCRCVDPENGSTVEGTETLVQGTADMPKCQEKMFESCEVSGVGGGVRGRRRRFKVEHGETYYDAENCRTCQCSDGNSTAFCSASGNCTVAMDDSPQSCMLPTGEELPHEGSTSLGCDSCGCRRGRLRCTHQHRCSVEGEEKDECDKCRRRPHGPVCGPDGRNHRSACEAVQCAGFPAPALENGPCQSRDVCADFPCEEDEICIANRGVACMGRRGCDPDQLRTCMPMEELRCPAEEEGEGEEEVCGSDGETYTSRCALIQSTSGVEVAHSGPCDMDECDGLMVCGTDQVTYADVCALRSLSSSARVDYLGQCERQGATIEELCTLVRSSGRCEHDNSTCDVLVTADGCCPICGGATTLAIDQEALDDASQTNTALRTVDEFAGQMAAAELFSELPGKCELEVVLTNTGDLQMLFCATSTEHAQFCMDKSEELAGAARVASGSSPQAFDYVLAAAAAPIDTITDDPGDGGAPPAVAAPFLLLAASLLVALAAAL